MSHPIRAAVYGGLLWLIPFVVACLIFPLREQGSPLFETLMPIAVVTSGVLFVVLYFSRIDRPAVRETVVVGLLWMAVSLVLDLALFMWGPMKMSLASYMADIGLAYSMYPVLTVGVGILLRRRADDPHFPPRQVPLPGTRG